MFSFPAFPSRFHPTFSETTSEIWQEYGSDRQDTPALKSYEAGRERRKLNRALQAINSCNRALLHAQNEAELLCDICRIVVETGGYRMAWVGYAEDDGAKSIRPVAEAGFEDGYLEPIKMGRIGSTEDDGAKRIRPVAQAGFEEGYLERLKISWADNQWGQGPVGRAIRTGEPCVIDDVQKDPRFVHWRMMAIARGYASVLSLPLKIGERVFGALAIYASTPNAFDAEEKSLLISLADNLSYGISTLRNLEVRRRAEEELRQSEARYRSLFENHHTVMLIIDPDDGRIMDANPAAARYYGWRHEELCRMNISQINQLTEAEILAEMALARKEERNYFLFRHALADGSLCDVEVFSGPILIQNKSLLYSIIHDVTERKLLDQALLHSERKFRTITEQMAEMVFVTDADGWLSYVSPMVQALFGYKPEEVTGHQFLEYLADEEVSRALLVFREALQNQVTDQVLEFRYRKKDGSFFDGEVTAHHFKDQHSSGMIGLLRDVTERNRHETLRREAEHALGKSEKQFRTLFEQSSAIKMILDPDTGKIINANQAAANFYGWSIEELSGMYIQEINPIPDAAIMQNLEKSRSSEQKHFVFSHKKADGSYRDVEVFSNKIEIAGKDFIYAIVFDITERILAEEKQKTLEAQLRKSQRLETIGTLAGGIAHDFNNILTPILGYAELGLLDLSEAEPQYDYFSEIKMASERAQTLVSQILLFSKAESHRPSVVSIQAVIGEALKLLRPSIPATIAISQQIDVACRNIMADASQLHQVIMNLSTNAFHAMEERGGVLQIQLREVTVDSAMREVHPELVAREYAELTISDTGTGISESAMEHIFEPFFTTKPVNKGTGLGLAVVHGIVSSFKGEITVESEPDKGTTFRIYLPLIHADTEMVALEELPVLCGDATILFVDDEPTTLKMMSVMMQKVGFKIEAVNSPTEALDLFQQNPGRFDLIITDLTMPEMTGIEFACQVHQTTPLMPVILMTGYEKNLEESTALEESCICKILKKPVKLTEMALTINACLAGGTLQPRN